MDLGELCFHLRHRRRMYVFDDRYLTVVAFVEGYNTALGGRPLSGFQNHVAERVLGQRSNVYWGVILASTESPAGLEARVDINELPERSQLALTHRLIDLLEEYKDQSRDL